MKYLIIIVVSLSLFNDSKISENDSITFSLEDLTKKTTIRLSELGVTDIEYIPLETNEKSYISGNFDMMLAGSEILAGKDFYIIKHFNEIKKFSENGSFVASIGVTGRGPEEFLTAHDIDINRKTREIYVVDGWKKKFFVYSENGSFLRSFPAPVNTVDFKLTPEGILCYSSDITGDTKYSYTLIDNAGNILERIPNKYQWNLISKNGAFVLNENIFYEHDNQLFKKEVYSDTIYRFNNGKFVPHITLNHGNKLITPVARSVQAPMDLMTKFISQENIFEFGDYIYYEFLTDRHKHTFIGSKKTNSKRIMINNLDISTKRFKGFINDIDGGPALLPYTVKNNNIMVCIADAILLKKYQFSKDFTESSPRYPNKKKELEKLLKNLKEDDNPVLILMKIK